MTFELTRTSQSNTRITEREDIPLQHDSDDTIITLRNKERNEFAQISNHM